MIAFRDPALSDRVWVEDCFSRSGNQGCEYSFVTLFVWKDVFHQQTARLDGYLLERLRGRLGGAYLFPAGSGPLLPALEALAADARERGEPCRLVCVTPEQRAQLAAVWPGRFTEEEDRDGFDYLYDIDRLADLPGRRLQSKRNHINRFESVCPDWSVEEIGPENLAECAAMDREWNRLRRGQPEDGEDTLADERHALSLAFCHYRELGLSGLLLRAEGRVAAFTMGSPIGPDTFDVHFEKAFSDLPGAYPLINREFARWLRERHPGLRWLNREDDMGLEGLRQAKSSYHPDRMVEKSTVELLGAP